MTEQRNASGTLALLQRDGEVRRNIVQAERRRRIEPTWRPVPEALAPELQAMLREQGIERLYAHQERAVLAALGGSNVVVTSPTASGKTLCYTLPVLQALLCRQQPSLLLFPTKALAHDQLQRLRRDLQLLGLDPSLAVAYDGDASPAERRLARERGRLLVSNPDMLHAGLLPDHVRWREALGALAFVVLDEIHTYRGVFGSQVAGVLDRLRRLCAFYGGMPRFLAASASIANPRELAEALMGEEVELVDGRGAPEPARDVVLYNPPMADADLGIRRLASEDAQRIALDLIAGGVQTVCFVRSRLLVEQMVISLRREVAGFGLDPDVVAGYRGGYLGEERRAVEVGLRKGSIRCVVSTSALELGIDVSGLGACILVGYPGSSAGFWQRLGRVGRSGQVGVGVLVAEDNPLDQYLLANAHQLLGSSPEAARVNLNNLHVRAGQLRCALYELPMDASEVVQQPLTTSLLEGLQARGDARLSHGRWYWAGGSHPAGDVSLRTADPRRVEVVVRKPDGDDSVLGQVEAEAAYRWLHPGAVYLHQGAQYLVRSLNMEGGHALVEPVVLPYLTVAAEQSEIGVEEIHSSQSQGARHVAQGTIRVTNRVTSFRREHIVTHQVLSRERLDLPERTYYTEACWLAIGVDLVDRLEQAGLWGGDRDGSRGPNWEAQRRLALERDGHRCAHCGASELPGHSHHVHHRVPFQSFGWIPGVNEAYLAANDLDNLVTLCPACHRRAEQEVGLAASLTDLGHLMRALVPIWVLCDPEDIGMSVEIQAGRRSEPTLYVYDRAPGGSGIAEALPPLVPLLLAAARQRVEACPCPAGCPSCIGPVLGNVPDRKRRVLALVDGLLAT